MVGAALLGIGLASVVGLALCEGRLADEEGESLGVGGDVDRGAVVAGTVVGQIGLE